MDNNLDGLKDIAKTYKKLLVSAFEVVKRFAKWLSEVWKRSKSKIIEFYQFEEDKKKQPIRKNKMDFNRQKIRHQVFERKPRHLVKKVIH